MIPNVLPVAALAFALSSAPPAQPAGAPAVVLLGSVEPGLVEALRQAGLTPTAADPAGVLRQLDALRAGGARVGLHAEGTAIATALDLVMERGARVTALTLAAGCEPVIEGLRRDVPVLLVANGHEPARVRAGMRELAHQLAIAGAPATLVTEADSAARHRHLATFLADRLCDGRDTDVRDAARARALAAVCAERGDVEAARGWLERAGKLDAATLRDVACDPRFVRLRGEAFSAFLCTHAQPGPASLCPDTEPGLAYELHIRVLAADGTPAAGATLHLWQTDAAGRYTHDDAPNADDRARLQAVVRTDADGACLLRTVRPGGYPGTMIPAHVHVVVTHGGQTRGIEILFADDPRLSDAFAARVKQRGWVVADVDAQGRPTGPIEIRLGARR